MAGSLRLVDFLLAPGVAGGIKNWKNRDIKTRNFNKIILEISPSLSRFVKIILYLITRMVPC